MSSNLPKPEILSLFCGCGGLDLGFEAAGYQTSLAYDRREDAVSSWNRNRTTKNARVHDIRELDLSILDEHYGRTFKPSAVIGGPPCQGFSVANRNGSYDDPRNSLVQTFFDLALTINKRSRLDFIVMENVPAITGVRGGDTIDIVKEKLTANGFNVATTIMDAHDYGVSQRRKRFILVAINSKLIKDTIWKTPDIILPRSTVRSAIGSLPPPAFYMRGINRKENPHHENHWCMTPKSQKFFDGTLREGYKATRSFRTLLWDEPSYTVSYGNREVHVHPSATRRLSVFEAMKLQGFPDWFVLNGSLSSQIMQVSEAVPPPLANHIAKSVNATVTHARISTS